MINPVLKELLSENLTEVSEVLDRLTELEVSFSRATILQAEALYRLEYARHHRDPSPSPENAARVRLAHLILVSIRNEVAAQFAYEDLMHPFSRKRPYQGRDKVHNANSTNPIKQYLRTLAEAAHLANPNMQIEDMLLFIITQRPALPVCPTLLRELAILRKFHLSRETGHDYDKILATNLELIYQVLRKMPQVSPGEEANLPTLLQERMPMGFAANLSNNLTKLADQYLLTHKVDPAPLGIPITRKVANMILARYRAADPSDPLEQAYGFCWSWFNDQIAIQESRLL